MMMDTTYEFDVENDDRYRPPEKDLLGVLTSTLAVVEQGEQVWIEQGRIDILSEQWADTAICQAAVETPIWDERYHFHDGSERTVNWLLLLDALNFCFWAEKDQPRWRIEYKGEALNGYWAEAAALKRAIEEDIPLWDAAYLSTLSSETMAHIFRGEPAQPAIPLLEQRLHNAREVGHVLLEQYEGQFSHAIKQANGDALQLALLLTRHFPSFNDSAHYRKQEVRFFKRAQICVADIASAFHGKQWGAFHNLSQLTIFADYKLPQVLRHYGILVYTPTLAERVDTQQLLATGSEEELEIRANTVWACELLRRALSNKGVALNASEIDQKLWLLGQSIPEMRPYHRTYTTYY